MILNQALRAEESNAFSLSLSFLYPLPSLALFLLGCNAVIIWVGWLGEKNGRDCSGFSDLAFHFVKPYCYVPLVVQSNLHTLVVLSFTEGFRTIFRLREKELEKNWTDQKNWAMNLNHIFVKRLRGFWRWRVKKIVCFSAFKICDLIKATHLRRPEEGSLLKYFEDNDPAG